jgi:hypothetical protein
LTEKPKRIFIQLLKKKVGTRRYSNTSKKRDNKGNRSKKKLKNKNSAIKKIVPGNPKKTKQFIKAIKNNLGQRKLIPLISVISLVLNLRFIASTNKNELVDRSAWLINIQKLASINADWPLITHIVSQCISTTVE